uniref:Uncharacterized protein n=1 Tax=Anguilla anguilla TaxID=7936 RepID=A0A0E9TRY9_ANGAN
MANSQFSISYFPVFVPMQSS